MAHRRRQIRRGPLRKPPAHEQWLRVIELCRPGRSLPRGTDLTLDVIYAHAVDTGLLIAEPAAVMALLDEALLLDTPPSGRAALLRRSARVACDLGDLDRGSTSSTRRSSCTNTSGSRASRHWCCRIAPSSSSTGAGGPRRTPTSVKPCD